MDNSYGTNQQQLERDTRAKRKKTRAHAKIKFCVYYLNQLLKGYRVAG